MTSDRVLVTSDPTSALASFSALSMVIPNLHSKSYKSGWKDTPSRFAWHIRKPFTFSKAPFVFLYLFDKVFHLRLQKVSLRLSIVPSEGKDG